MTETIERVLFNPNNGKLAVGIRLRFMDKYHSEDLGAFDGKYKISLEPTDCDAWAIDNQDGVWIVIVSEFIKNLEDLGPL